jgi:DNA mismatch repair protein MutS
MFYEDALEAAPILGVALTKRNEVPMCGVPHHAMENYISKLIRAGKKAAICEQMEDPMVAKGIVRREVTSILTSGTATSDSALEHNRNLFLAGVYRSGKTYGLTMLDLSTGLFWGEESDDASVVRENIAKFTPAECVVAETQAKDQDIKTILSAVPSMQISPCADWTFDLGSAQEKLVRHFNVHSLDGFGCEGRNVVCIISRRICVARQGMSGRSRSVIPLSSSSLMRQRCPILILSAQRAVNRMYHCSRCSM